MKRRAPASLVIGFALLGALAALALAAPLITSASPYQAQPADILLPPSAEHWAGTDSLGRDLFARIAYGGRASLSVAAGITLLSVGFGALLGAVSGLAGGWVDALAMRLAEIVMSIPGLVIALALAAALGPSLKNLVLILGLLGAPFHMRLFRGETLILRERPFVKAARAMGASFPRLLFVHILPNLAPLIATFASSTLGGALVTASALSFIGLGAQPPTPEWGALIYEGRNNILYEWWCAILPGLAVSAAALGAILVGDGLRDRFDARSEPR